MNWIDLDNKEIIAKKAYQWCEQKIEQYHAQSMYLPAGGTPVGLYREFEAARPKWLQAKALLQVDEVLSGNKKGLFRSFFAEHLPSYFPQLQSPKEGSFQQAELAVLGLGVNGHIAFHEPGQDPDFKFGLVSTCETTQHNLDLEAGDQTISYGAGAFLATKAVLLIITGDKKEIVSKLDQGFDCPASLLFKHRDLTVLCQKSLRE